MSTLKHPNLLDLPNELLVKILEFLPATFIGVVRQTCSKLYQISQSIEILKKQKFVFEFINLNEDEEILNRIIEMDLSYLNLELDVSESQEDELNHIEALISKMICFLGSRIRSLSLDFFHYDLSFSLFEDIMLTCVNLKELYLYSIKFKSLGNSRLKLEDANTNLEILKMRGGSFPSTVEIEALLNFYPAIKTFQLKSFLCQGKVNDFELFDEFIVKKINTYNNCIQDLDLSSVSEYVGFSKNTFTELASGELKLRSICLKYQRKISKQEFKILFSKQNNLEEIILKDCDWFDAECLRYLATHYPKLKRLSLESTFDPRFGKTMGSDFDAECLLHLLNYCPELEHLSLDFYWHTFDFPSDVQMSAQVGRNLKVLEIQHVHLSGGDTLGLNFRNLEHVVLDDCSTDDLVNHFEFLEDCRLKHFTFKDCQLQGTDIVRIITASQNTLITLNLYAPDKTEYPTMISDEVCFSKLEELTIYGCGSLNCAIIQKLHFPCLRKLDFSSYRANQDCKKIITNCPILEDLYLMADEELDDDVSMNLRNALPFLRSFLRGNSHGTVETIVCKRRKLKN